MNKIFSIKSHQKSNQFDYENLHVSKTNLACDEATSEMSSSDPDRQQPKYGIHTGDSNEQELDKIMENIDLWGIDIFMIDELSHHRPLTSVAFTIFKVYYPRN